MNELTYIRSGDYWIPNLSLSQQENKPLGKYGRMRKKYLQEHRPVLWNRLILSEQLYPHLREILQKLGDVFPELVVGVAQDLLLHQLLAHTPQAAGEVDDLGNVLNQVKVYGGKHDHKNQQNG